MRGVGIETGAASAECEPARQPFHSLSPKLFDHWLDNRLLCSVGKREFKLGRYFLTRFRNGFEFDESLTKFRVDAADFKKIGMLALFVHDEALCTCVEDELRMLGEAMCDAGLADSGANVIDGGTIAIPMDVTCPVTGLEVTYEFFSVAFTRHADSVHDPLYDPSLSAPFTAVNTTSDAFAFAMLVRDQSYRAWDCPPHEITDRADIERLFRKCATAWQNMSISTIQRYSQVTADSSRGVHISEDRTHWIAAHNDPVFAELEKCPFVHEMPIAYANRLCEKWLATIFDGREYIATRDGQAGGISLSENEEALDELYQF